MAAHGRRVVECAALCSLWLLHGCIGSSAGANGTTVGGFSGADVSLGDSAALGDSDQNGLDATVATADGSAVEQDGVDGMGASLFDVHGGATDGAPSLGDAGSSPDAGASADGGAAANDGGSDTAATDAAADAGAGADAPSGDAVGKDTDDGLPDVGPVQGNCKGKEGTVTCSSDWKHRLMCVSGAWTSMQHCGFGACRRFKSAGGAVLSECFVPKAKQVELAKACSRYIQCYQPPMSLEDCVRLNLHRAKIGPQMPQGQAREVVNIAVSELLPNLKCALATKTCSELAECLYWFGAKKCAKPQNAGCDGDVAWSCLGKTKPLAIACHVKGLSCHVFKGKAACVKPFACVGKGAGKCDGDVAQECVLDDAGKVVGVKSDCSMWGLSCISDANLQAAGCAKPQKSCDNKFVGTCVGGHATNCVSGVAIKRVCGVGQSCLVEGPLQQLSKSCPTGAKCHKTACLEGGSCSQAGFCKGKTVHYCEGGWPVALDCGGFGMACVTTKFGPRCQ